MADETLDSMTEMAQYFDQEHFGTFTRKRISKQHPELSIAIITWNSRQLLQDCLESIYAHTQKTKFEIVIVDNGSNDGSIELLEDSFKRARLIKNTRNRGVAPARNQAIKAARGRFVLILDVDTRVTAGAIDRLVEFARKTPDAGIIGARLIDPDGNLQLTCRRFPSILTPILRRLEFIRFFRESRMLREQTMADWDHTQTREVDYVIGACQLIRREVIEEVGLLDERIFYGPEDIDFCLRAHANGWKIFYFPHSTIMHYGRRITKKLFSKITLKHFWGLFYFFNKHGYMFQAKSHAAIIMSRTVERILLFLSDFFAVTTSYWLWSKLRGALGFYTLHQPEELAFTGTIIAIYWFFVFLFFGLYRTWYVHSRVDEVLSVCKAVFFGVLIIFISTFESSDLTSPIEMSRLLIVSYLFLMMFTVASGRSFLRTMQRRLLEKGIGLRRTLIVGWGEKAHSLYDKIKRFPALGFRVVGFIRPDPDKSRTIGTRKPENPSRMGRDKSHISQDHRETPKSIPEEQVLKNSNNEVQERQSYDGVPVLGALIELRKVLAKEAIDEVLIALSLQQQKKVMAVINQCAESEVKLSIIPDLYGVVMGRARTNQVYGTPLIEILPEHMSPWEKKTKRLFDILISSIVLLTFSPLLIGVGVLVKLESRGSLFSSHQRVGLNGKTFRILKFRRKQLSKNNSTNRNSVSKDKSHFTRIGMWIRKVRFNRLLLFWNILKGDMSLVGPRPAKPDLVEKLRKKLPIYNHRLRVRPGIIGWAKIKGKDGETIDEIRQSLQYDIFYLENISLRLDFKIILMSIYLFLRRGRK